MHDLLCDYYLFIFIFFGLLLFLFNWFLCLMWGKIPRRVTQPQRGLFSFPSSDCNTSSSLDDDDDGDGDGKNSNSDIRSCAFHGNPRRRSKVNTGGDFDELQPLSFFFSFTVWIRHRFTVINLLCLYTCKCLSKIRTLFENQCTDCNVHRLLWE